MLGIEEREDKEAQQEHIINYAVNLPVEATALTGNRQWQNKVGLVELHNKEQFDYTARAVACLCTLPYRLEGQHPKETKRADCSCLMHADVL